MENVPAVNNVKKQAPAQQTQRVNQQQQTESIFTNGNNGNGNDIVDAGDFNDKRFANFIESKGFFGQKFDAVKDKIQFLKNEFEINTILNKPKLNKADVDKAVKCLMEPYEKYMNSKFDTVPGSDFTELNQNFKYYQDLYDKIREKNISANNYNLDNYFMDQVEIARKKIMERYR